MKPSNVKHDSFYQPQRIAFFVEPSIFTYINGISGRFRNHITYLIDAGCEVLIVTTGRGFTLPFADKSAFKAPPAEFLGAKVVECFSYGLPVAPQLPIGLSITPSIYRELRAFNPDLIHCTSPAQMQFTCVIFSRLLRIPLVISYHTHVFAYLKDYGLLWLAPEVGQLLGLGFQAANCTMSVSHYMVNRMNETIIKGSKKHLKLVKPQVWPKGVNVDVFSPKFRCREMRSRLTNGHPDDILLLNVGRVSREKGLEFVRPVLQALPHIRMAIVGQGPWVKNLKETFKDTNTVFIDALYGDELSQAYASADIFIMPSESETFGLVVIEAMASGLPVVAVHAEGVRDTIDNPGVSGYFYESGDLAGCMEIVGALARDAGLRERVGRAAREEVTRHNLRAASFKILREIYTRAVVDAMVSYREGVGGRWAGLVSGEWVDSVLDSEGDVEGGRYEAYTSADVKVRDGQGRVAKLRLSLFLYALAVFAVLFVKIWMQVLVLLPWKCVKWWCGWEKRQYKTK